MGNLIGRDCGDTRNRRGSWFCCGVGFGRVDVGLDAMHELVEVVVAKLVDGDGDNEVPYENNKVKKGPS